MSSRPKPWVKLKPLAAWPSQAAKGPWPFFAFLSLPRRFAPSPFFSAPGFFFGQGSAPIETGRFFRPRVFLGGIWSDRNSRFKRPRWPPGAPPELKTSIYPHPGPPGRHGSIWAVYGGLFDWAEILGFLTGGRVFRDKSRPKALGPRRVFIGHWFLIWARIIAILGEGWGWASGVNRLII